MVPSSSAHCVTGSTTSASCGGLGRGRSQRRPADRAALQPLDEPGRVRRRDRPGSRPSPAARGSSLPEHAQELGRRPDAGPGQRVVVHAPDRGDVGAVRPGCRACGSRAAGRPSGRARARPGRCPGRSASPSRKAGGPALPSASARLMKASTLLTPWLCCSGPRAVRTIAVRGLAQQCAACSIERCRHAGDALDPVRPVRRRRRAGPRSKPVVRVGDEVVVDQAVADGDVEQPVGERRIGAGRELQVQGRALRAVAVAPRIDHDQLPAAALLLVEILHHRRHGFGRVAADEQDRLGLAGCPPAGTAGRGRCRTPCSPAAAAEAMQKRPL